MITRYACALNQIPLDSLDTCIHITDLTELSPKHRIVTAATPGNGLRLLRRTRDSLTVRVSFILHEYDTVRRRNVLQKVYAWASPGGTLTVSDRPGQQLTVICEKLPAMSALTWLDEMSIDFTACEIPFWEASQRTAVTTSDNALLTLPGTADECPVSCTVVNTGDAAFTTLTLTVGDTSMTFTGLSVAAGESFLLNVNDGCLSAKTGDTSVLLSRTDDSSDLLLACAGKEVSVSAAADQPVVATFSARGRYL
ncbi:MAG: hypothetical protein IJZ74_10685 [Clostridia bacterium]|nr:hypothetical protein [Clostridia bacterium]